MAHTERFSGAPLDTWVWRDFGRLFCIMRFHETIWAAVRCAHPPNRKNSKRPEPATARPAINLTLLPEHVERLLHPAK